MKEIKFVGKFIIESEIELETGLHIGTEENNMEIGGIDNPVIKDSLGRPYIPGSSLKGKLRTLMEYYHEKIKPDLLVYTVKKDSESQSIKIHMCDEEDCPVCNLFGRNHGKHKFVSDKEKKEEEFKNLMPTRLIVRDSLLIEDSITPEMMEYLETKYTEVKNENNLDRITAIAHPRKTERVPAGARFSSEFVINVYEGDGIKYLKEFLRAMMLLEDDYLGGSGSRGYGKIKFKDVKIKFRNKNFYENPKIGEKCVEVNLEEVNWEELENKLLSGE
ncbi:type III-A CRISPR-associated RAMP protein Csm3 [Thermosipho ferrireducens]|uniref:CRISPR system Cms endoribonuclease Csm3 n=1 Tax=Thermosipho ferrireducens TaxID=2571116 RepID=A0ABX7SBA6_9BACT|nr:type III-A CRISPR-associated RAMP protein Csm3 [Thermosipho ferrireducens]QTA38791.1 type III-A CRISPR-associated RAMP protein Csm3 [Thermosipho ferrireducens]